MKKTPAAEIVARFSTPGKFISTMSFGSWVTKVPKKKPGTEKESPGRPFGRRCGVFYNFHTGANVGLAVVEPCDPPFGWEAPVKTDPPGRGFFQGGENTLMPVDPGECRQHALDCVRMAQTATSPEARKIWSDLARTWLRFATDLEASQCLLDEWGRPKAKKHQSES